MPPTPSFAPSPNQFTPKRGRPPNDDVNFAGSMVRLFGRNFNVGQLGVRFGAVEAPVLSRGPSRIEVTVPPLDPGPCTITVTTGGGSATSTDTFEVLNFPVIHELDPFGFTRDPSGEGLIIAITGQHFIVDAGQLPFVTCLLSARFDPDLQVAGESVILPILSIDPSTITVQVPPIADFDRLVGGTGMIMVEFPDGALIESQPWDIVGL